MIILYYTIIFILLLIIFFSLLFLLTPLFSRIPFVPVRKKFLNEIISAMELNNKSILYDLGCGDGRVLFAAAKRNPNISCIGIEIAPFPFLFAKIKRVFNSLENVHILYGDFLKTNLYSASHVFLYLFPKALDSLLPKFEKELKVGSKVVSIDFRFSTRKPNKILEIKLKKWQKNKKLYIYEF